MATLAVEWLLPVTDRNQNDITNKTSKGYLNTSDLNRIENNTKYLFLLLKSQGYFSAGNVMVFKTDWGYSDYFHKSDFDRIRKNVKKLFNVWYTIPGYRQVLETMKINYSHINNLEFDLGILNYYLELMIEGYSQYCGTTETGG